MELFLPIPLLSDKKNLILTSPCTPTSQIYITLYSAQIVPRGMLPLVRGLCKYRMLVSHSIELSPGLFYRQRRK